MNAAATSGMVAAAVELSEDAPSGLALLRSGISPDTGVACSSSVA